MKLNKQLSGNTDYYRKPNWLIQTQTLLPSPPILIHSIIWFGWQFFTCHGKQIKNITFKNEMTMKQLNFFKKYSSKHWDSGKAFNIWTQFIKDGLTKSTIFFFFLLHPMACRILALWLGNKSMFPALEARSLNNLTAKCIFRYPCYAPRNIFLSVCSQVPSQYVWLWFWSPKLRYYDSIFTYIQRKHPYITQSSRWEYLCKIYFCKILKILNLINLTRLWATEVGPCLVLFNIILPEPKPIWNIDYT